MAAQIVGYLAWLGRMMINYHLNYRGTTRVRYDLFSKLQELGLTYHRSRAQGDAIYRLTTDAFGPWGIMDVVIGTGVAAVTLTVMTVILLSRSVPLTLAAFTVAPLMIWSNWRFGVRIHKRALDSKQIDADLTAHIQQAMTRIPLAQAFRRENREFRGFRVAVGRSCACPAAAELAGATLSPVARLHPSRRAARSFSGTAATSSTAINSFSPWLAA
jgi:subfamily B ATP-binding cassette protein MsbA